MDAMVVIDELLERIKVLTKENAFLKASLHEYTKAPVESSEVKENE